MSDYFDELMQAAGETGENSEFERTRRMAIESRRRMNLHPHDPEFLEGPENEES